MGNGGTELNTTSNLYDLDYRNYDPILGRMNGVDPMATKYASLSPYNFSFNDPVTFSDPSGADPYQRSDDTWWVASRTSLQGSKYAGLSSFGDFAYQHQVGFGGETNPWAWTGMSREGIYGAGIFRFGKGFLPGEFYGGTRFNQEYNVDVYEVWEDIYTSGRLTGSTFLRYRYDVKPKQRGNHKEDLAKHYINKYESNLANINSRAFLGYALLESGVGGDFIAAARELAIRSLKARELAIRSLNPDDETMRINDVLNQIKELGTTIKQNIPNGKLAEPYLTLAGANMLLTAAAINAYNEFFIVPRVRQFAPDYYRQHIESRPRDNGSGGGGSTDPWFKYFSKSGPK